jgi:hypothetical protein
MMHFSLRKLKDAFWPVGENGRHDEPGSPFYSDSEIASLRQRAKANRDEAMALEEAHGTTVHPRVAAIRARPSAPQEPKADEANAVTG